MRSNRVVVLTPLLDDALGVRQGDEPVLVEAFSEAARFMMGIP